MDEIFKIFKDIDLEGIRSMFPREEDCLKFLAQQKWKDGFVCRKCGHRNYCEGRTPSSRRCTRCKHEESAKAHTIFHHCRLPLPEAFALASVICRNPGISSYELARNLNLRQMTCWKLRKKIEECQQLLEKAEL